MYNCPNCAGNLVFDIESQKLKCEYCSTLLDPYEYQKSQDAEESDMFGVTVYTCPQCGGEIMTTNVTAAGFCTYCGASTILDSRMRDEKRPAHIIPFTRTKEDCRKSYSSLVRRALFAPREFRDPEFLDRFRGIYIPYWVYNYDFSGDLHLKGSKTYRRGDYKITDHYSLSGEVDARYHGLTYDASSSFDDTVAAAIAPFEAAKMQPFTPSILCGFYADAPDVGNEVYREPVLNSISQDSIERLSGVPEYRSSGADMPSADEFKNQLRGSSMNLSSEEPVCAYLPVWFLTYRKDDRVAYAVMNGSTGKITADLPVDKKKYILGSILLAVPIFAVLASAFFSPISAFILSYTVWNCPRSPTRTAMQTTRALQPPEGRPAVPVRRMPVIKKLKKAFWQRSENTANTLSSFLSCFSSFQGSVLIILRAAAISPASRSTARYLLSFFSERWSLSGRWQIRKLPRRTWSSRSQAL